MSSPAIFIKSFHVRITIGTKQFHYTLLPFPLNDDFTVFHGTASPLSNAKSGLVEYTIPNLDFQSLSFADMAQSSVSFR